MFDHVTIRVADREAAERFYNTVLQTLGIDESYRTRAFTEWQDFGLTAADADHPPTQRLHVGFVAGDRDRVHQFWEAGVEAGYTDDGRPGPRPEYGPDYYGGFLLDPDGNSAEAVHLARPRRGGIIDHLWIRVADMARARAFYDTIAPHAGLRRGSESPERVQFLVASGSFSLVSGAPTKYLHMAFPTQDDGDVQRFHQAAVDAGYSSNGKPAERRRYHPGYYAAYVLDPDGNNIEIVNHHRE